MKTIENLYTEFRTLCSAHDTISMGDRFESILEDANHIAATYKEVRMRVTSTNTLEMKIDAAGKTFGAMTVIYNKSNERIEFHLRYLDQRVNAKVVTSTLFSRKTEGGLLVLDAELASIHELSVFGLQQQPFTQDILHSIFTILMCRVVESLRK